MGYGIVFILGSIIGLGADPVIWIATIAAAFNKHWWMPPLIGAAAAIVSEVLVQAIAPGYHGQAFVMRVVTGVVVGFLVLGVKKLVRLMRPPGKSESDAPKES